MRRVIMAPFAAVVTACLAQDGDIEAADGWTLLCRDG